MVFAVVQKEKIDKMYAIRKGIDFSAGHSCFPPRPASSGSPNVFVNGIPCVRLSDTWPSHCCMGVCHGGVTSTGSPNVFVNGLSKMRNSDSISCGDKSSQHSPNIHVN